MAEEETTVEKTEPTPNGTFEDWFANQPDDVKSLITAHESGLKSALKAERDSTKNLSKQLTQLQGVAEKGSDLQKQLEAMQARLSESERHTAFIDGASSAGCTNPKAAYKLAKADEDLWRKDGTPDWQAIKETAPEFFQKVKANGSAGSGTDKDPNAGSKQHPMDTRMRQMLGLL